MYLLNLIFNHTQTDGRFQADHPNQTNPLLRSKVWLQLMGGPDPADVNSLTFNPTALPAGYSWAPISSDGSLLVSAGTPPFTNGSVPPFMALRIASSSAITPAPNLHCSVIFGREPRATQPFASPFTISGAYGTTNCAMFDWGDQQLTSNATGLYLPMRSIANKPSGPSISHHYEFEIGLIVNDGAYTFGHDPELDVSM